ncbi:hypothetical protein YQE_00511, partial [Dendroctonus ponderosae]
MIWNAVIFGPHDTPFEDGTFKLTIEFTEEYPNKPPTVRFVSHMFHPNVYADGGICLDILQNRWSPTYDVSAILTSIQLKISLLLLKVWRKTRICQFGLVLDSLWQHFAIGFEAPSVQSPSDSTT